MKFYSLLLLLIHSSAWARPAQLIPAQFDNWVRFKCVGVVTPRGDETTVERDILFAHLQINASAPYPTVASLRDSNSGFFRNLTKICTERRRSKVEIYNFAGQWLDWGSDWGYTYLVQSEYTVPSNTLAACRNVNEPCTSNAQCCGSGSRITSCNTALNTCEALLIREATTSPLSPN